MKNKPISILLIIILLITPIYAIHTIQADEYDFIIQAQDQDNVGYLNIINGTSAYLHNPYDTNATALLGNITADTDNDIITTHAFLDNDREESNSTEIYDDDETFWTLGTIGVGSTLMVVSEELIEVTKGTSSYKLLSGAGAKARWQLDHNYPSAQDWSNADFICFYWYGENTGAALKLWFYSPDGANNFNKVFNDDFSGWKRIVFPKNSFNEVGSPDWATMDRIFLEMNTDNVLATWYLDRFIIDVGQWVGVEISIPDVLDSSVQNVKLYSWSGAAYEAATFMRWDSENDSPGETWTAANLHFLDGSVLTDFYTGDIWDSMDSFLNGERGTTRASVHVSSSKVVVYSYLYGVVNRVGFAVKMAPDDGQDNSTYGISQMRFKAVIYYDNNGETTIIHRGEEDAGTDYGLILLIGLVIAFITIFVVINRKR